MSESENSLEKSSFDSFKSFSIILIIRYLSFSSGFREIAYILSTDELDKVGFC